MCMHLCMYVCMHACMHVCMPCTYASMYVYIQMNYTYAHTYGIHKHLLNFRQRQTDRHTSQPTIKQGLNINVRRVNLALRLSNTALNSRLNISHRLVNKWEHLIASRCLHTYQDTDFTLYIRACVFACRRADGRAGGEGGRAGGPACLLACLLA